MPMFFINTLLILFFHTTFCFSQNEDSSNIQEVKKIQHQSEKGYYQFFGGAITYHFFDFKEDSKKFKKNIGDHGKLISHPFFGAEKAIVKGDDIESKSIFIFNDSLGSLAYGYQNASSIKLNSFSEAGYFWSAYFIKQSVWEKNEINLPVRIKFGRHLALVPIVGLIQSFNFNIYKNYDLKFNFAITPNTATALIGIKKPF